jgi:hypothetical protein
MVATNDRVEHSECPLFETRVCREKSALRPSCAIDRGGAVSQPQRAVDQVRNSAAAVRKELAVKLESADYWRSLQLGTRFFHDQTDCPTGRGIALECANHPVQASGR